MAFPEEIGNDFIAEEAFDASDNMLNITPKSKTAAAHEVFAEKLEANFSAPVSKQEPEAQPLTEEEKKAIVIEESQQDLLEVGNV
jgi:hypothetical protein